MATRSIGRMSGVTLRALASAVKAAPARALLVRVLRRQLGVEALAALGDELRAPLPLDPLPVAARATRSAGEASLEPPPAPAWPRTSAALAEAFRAGTLTPEAAIERLLAGARQLSTLSPPRGPLLTYDTERALEAARASQERIARGAPRSPLEGIPITVKEEIDVAGLPTRLGTGWRANTPAAADAVAVARLREAGAVIIGQTPMTEHGLSPFGVNPNRTMPRNAHDSGRVAGGSSTGAAVAVALGIGPIALGADGGGSLRIPASLNGVFALKPTFGRIPLVGHAVRGGTTLSAFGPMGASTLDLAHCLAVAAGPDRGDPASLHQTPLTPDELVQATRRRVTGLRIGIDEQDWAAATPAAAKAAREALTALEREGAELVSIRIPLAIHAAALGYVTFGIEALSSLREARLQHLGEHGLDTQVLLIALTELASEEYLDAQRLRATLRAQVSAALTDVDLIATPTTVSTAPAVTDPEARSGFVDATALDGLCRYAFLANLTGLPASSAPVGLDERLPLGLQLIGDAWDEACVLTATAMLERTGVAHVGLPALAVDPPTAAE